MRFNSPEHLEAWRTERLYPAIHTKFASFIATHIKGARLLDLGCGYGLLGEGLKRSLRPGAVVGIEADSKVVDAAELAGVSIHFERMKVGSDNLEGVAEIITEHRLDVLVARRVLPELFGHDLQAGRRFAGIIAKAGIAEVFLEGRVVTRNAVNPLASITGEVALLEEYYAPRQRLGAMAYLRTR